MRPATEMDAMPRDSSEIFAEVCTLLQPYAGDAGELRGSTDLNADLQIDSVAAMDLIMEVEDRFEVDIPINLLSEIRTVQDLVAVVEKQLETT